MNFETVANQFGEGRKVVVPFQVSDDQTSAGNLFIYLTAQPLDYILKGHVLVVGNGAQRELNLNNNGNAEGTGQFSVVVTDADGKTATQALEANLQWLLFLSSSSTQVIPRISHLAGKVMRSCCSLKTYPQASRSSKVP